MSNVAGLTSLDVQRLLQDPSAAARASMADKITRGYVPSQMSASERALAEDIFRLMMRDAEVRVRKALSEGLKQNPDVPREIAMALAKDVEQVAEPMIEFSSVLSDTDLMEIVRTSSARKQTAVARRESLSAEVSHVIATEGEVTAVAALMENDTAKLLAESMTAALDRFGNDARVNGAMARRQQLPVAVAERLVALVSANFREHLVTHHELPVDLATDLVLQARERATVGLAQDASREDVPTLVERLHRNRRLTPSLVLRALCTGELDFFECAMAKMAGIPVVNAYRLIHDEGGLGLARLVERCSLSQEFLSVAKVAIEVSRELQYDGQPGDRERFMARMLERVLTCFENPNGSENLDYLIGKLGRTNAPRAMPRAVA
jgi:uncharacterized protein (DUF2336 family)